MQQFLIFSIEVQVSPLDSRLNLRVPINSDIEIMRPINCRTSAKHVGFQRKQTVQVFWIKQLSRVCLVLARCIFDGCGKFYVIFATRSTFATDESGMGLAGVEGDEELCRGPSM
jgi:hypothetical protein